MDHDALHHPLVPPTQTLRDTALVTPEEAARLQQLPAPEYWAQVAGELEWSRPWDTVLDGHLTDFRYFAGATGNVSVNCLDRHARLTPDKAALLWEREDGAREEWSFERLRGETARFAAALQDQGVVKGDRVALLLSNIPEAFVAIHACYRLGAIYSVIFAGFSASAVRDRLTDAQPKVVVCADASLRRGKVVPLLTTLRAAMVGVSSIERVVVVERMGLGLELLSGEVGYAALLAAGTREAAPVQLEANEPGFIIYTSGTTNKPKGLVHAGLGFLVGASANVKWALNLGPGDVYWCTADVGWLTFPIFALVGGLAHGATHVIYEGSIDTPSPARPYELMARYGVTKVFTAPTALRMLRRAGDEARAGHDLSRLQLISLVGEPLDPETWAWTTGALNGIFVNNTYGQTETGTAWASSMVGATPTRPGSCGQALPGYRPAVVDEQGAPVAAGELGFLTLNEPFPSLARTVWGDHERYLETYFSEFPGRYASADAALIDADEMIWVTGRVDDVMNVSGHRIGTMELEAALIAHPQVSEAAVVACPDELRGEVPVAFVVPRAAGGPGSGVLELEQALSQAIVDAVGSYARPARVYVVPTLPRTRSGKIMRRLLRELLASGEVRGDLSSLENPDAIATVSQIISPAAAGL